MFEIKFSSFARAAAVVFLCVGSYAAIGQTIDQIADAQRMKVAAELKVATAPAPAPAASAVEMPSRVPSEVRRTPERIDPTIVVYGLYIRDGKYVAELTDGRKLVTAAPGMRFKRMRIESIDASGVHLQAVGKCNKGCSLNRVVAVGGAL